jgi:CubicO group peptidase (beta-lactamase class C family)
MNPSQLAATLDAALAEHDFSGVVSVRHAATLLYERAAGFADRSNNVANTLATRFGIASGTKFFTALAIGKLIAAGRLDFATRLKDCVALDFPHYAPEITIRHLLTHTSGIPDYFDEEKITDFDNFSIGVPWYTVFGPRDYLASFPREPMKFAPGERFSYSNGGYILLGVVIEELTGRTYQEFVEQEVLAPAGMHRSGFFAMNRLPEQTAFGYVKDQHGWRTNIYNLPIVGASDGGMYTTAADLDRLWQAFWDGAIVPPELVEIYARPFVSAATEGPGLSYGHGLWLRERPDASRTVFITGGDAGVSFRSSVNRASGLRVSVISNTSDGAWPILRILDTALA